MKPNGILNRGGEEIRRLKPRKKSILMVFEPHRKEIEKYLKQKKPDLKSGHDLILLVEYCDSLKAGS